MALYHNIVQCNTLKYLPIKKLTIFTSSDYVKYYKKQDGP